MQVKSLGSAFHPKFNQSFKVGAKKSSLQKLLLLLLLLQLFTAPGLYPGLPRWAGPRKVKPGR